ncbi:MAG: T9SS type A sorting domain-containing protein [Bacteroidetes bacterium]|nr:T9SS type A sorting domain-containing protein [Bacteroidota bacterium]
MKTTIIRSSLLLLLGTSLGHLRAQTLSRSVIASGGNSFSSSSLQADWTIGETVIGSFNGSSLLVNQGFQQGPDAAASSVKSPAKGHMHLYPNPSNGILNLSYTGTPAGVLRFSLWSTDGKQLNPTWVQQTSGLWTCDISALAPGSYFVQVFEAGTVQVLPLIKR